MFEQNNKQYIYKHKYLKKNKNSSAYIYILVQNSFNAIFLIMFIL